MGRKEIVCELIERQGERGEEVETGPIPVREGKKGYMDLQLRNPLFKFCQRTRIHNYPLNISLPNPHQSGPPPPTNTLWGPSTSFGYFKQIISQSPFKNRQVHQFIQYFMKTSLARLLAVLFILLVVDCGGINRWPGPGIGWPGVGIPGRPGWPVNPGHPGGIIIQPTPIPRPPVIQPYPIITPPPVIVQPTLPAIPINFCSSGLIWIGSTCAPQAPTISCSPGYILSNNICIWGGGSGSYSCIQGYTWNGACCVQSTVIVPSCSYGQYWNGYTCVQVQTQVIPTCYSGYFWDSLKGCCIAYPTGAGSCRSGYYWNGIICTVIVIQGNYNCQAGYIWAGNCCVVYPQVAVSCGFGFYWNGAQCVRTGFNSGNFCSGGQYWGGAGCFPFVGGRPSGCHNGYYWSPPANCCIR